MDNIATGRMGETVAGNFLIKKGYEIIARNYRAKLGEIDIVANDGGCIVFVEVKTRTSSKFGYPSEAVDSRKIKKIAGAANCFIAQNGIYEREFRFDVVEVYMSEKRINHIVGAFEFGG